MRWDDFSKKINLPEDEWELHLTSPVQGSSFSVLPLGWDMLPVGDDKMRWSLSSVLTPAKPFLLLVLFNRNSWLQVPCGIRPCCSVRRRMVQMIGLSYRWKDSWNEGPDPQSLVRFLSVEVLHVNARWSGLQSATGCQYDLRPLCSILFSELTTSLRNLNIWATSCKPLRGLGFQAEAFSTFWKSGCLHLGTCKCVYTNLW